MKVVGLVVEYNPFHNGHLYHLEQSRKQTGADYVVCVMSGNFTQRGEPAVVNKWSRTKMALLSGADLVVELPVIYAMSSAESFSWGAVKLLDSLGIVDCLCFGSENGRIEELDLIADTLVNEPESYKYALKEELSRGISFPAARESALTLFFERAGIKGIDVQAIISTSNNILGIEYLKALKKLGSKISPATIARVGNSYNTEYLTGGISSATSIRKYISNPIYQNQEIALDNVIPETSFGIIKEEFQHGRGPVLPSDYEGIILAALRKMSKEDIKALPYVSEGIENRIKAASDNAGTLEELLDRICTRRYTLTRVQRILFSSLIGLVSEDMDIFSLHGGPPYIRILGFNNNGKYLLSFINKCASLPVIVKTADYKNSSNPLIKKLLDIEARSTDIYVLAYKNPLFRKAGQDFTQNIIIV